MTAVINLAHKRFMRDPASGASYSTILSAISEAMQSQFPTRDEQVGAFSERLTIEIDIYSGRISIRPLANHS